VLNIVNIDKLLNESFPNWVLNDIKEMDEQYVFLFRNKWNTKQEDLAVLLEKKAIGVNLYQLWAWDRQFNEIRIKVKADTLRDETKFKEDLSKILIEYENRSLIK